MKKTLGFMYGAVALVVVLGALAMQGAVAAGSNQDYSSGAYAYPNYRASIGYFWVTYRF